MSRSLEKAEDDLDVGGRLHARPTFMNFCSHSVYMRSLQTISMAKDEGYTTLIQPVGSYGLRSVMCMWLAVRPSVRAGAAAMTVGGGAARFPPTSE